MEVTHMYKDGDLVLIKYKRGAKLAQIEAINKDHGTMLKIWNATRRTWGNVTWRPFVHVLGYATPSDARMYGYQPPAVTGSGQHV
jgi:hypothetical protein